MALQDPPDDEDMDGGISEARPPPCRPGSAAARSEGPARPPCLVVGGRPPRSIRSLVSWASPADALSGGPLHFRRM